MLARVLPASWWLCVLRGLQRREVRRRAAQQHGGDAAACATNAARKRCATESNRRRLLQVVALACAGSKDVYRMIRSLWADRAVRIAVLRATLRVSLVCGCCGADIGSAAAAPIPAMLATAAIGSTAERPLCWACYGKGTR